LIYYYVTEPLPRFAATHYFDTLFPFNGIGTAILQRKKFVEKWCNIIEKPVKLDEGSFSHYFRSPPGNGKTTFLMLLGEELERKNLYDVYYFKNAKNLDQWTERSFIQARAKALKQSKTLVVMVDEVHRNPNSSLWTYLLKEAKGIIVIGAGIPYLDSDSPQFRKKYPPSEMYFDCKSEDIKELIDVFVDQTKDRGISRDEIAAICHYICEYTSGHMFPMLKFCEHIFDQTQSDHLGDYGKYLTSKDFFDHEDYVTVRDRCFSSLPFDPICRILHGGVLESTQIKILDRLGYWNAEKKWFISKCLIDIIFNTVITSEKNAAKIIDSDVSFYDMSVKNKIEKVITAGFTHMRENDFEEPIYTQLEKYEDAIGFCWAWYIKTYFTQLHVSSQVQVPHEIKKRGKNPCIDFVFNGKNDVGIELIRNGNAKMCKEHADRFDNIYKRWRNSCAIVNIVLSGNINSRNLYESKTIPVFHYLKRTNTLYKGKKIFKTGVAKVPTPASNRGFSTMIHAGGKLQTNSLKYIR
jgi:hypothetical protein